MTERRVGDRMLAGLVAAVGAGSFVATAAAGSGQPTPKQIHVPGSRHAGRGRHPLDARLRQRDHLRRHGVRAGADAVRHVALQREAQSRRRRAPRTTPPSRSCGRCSRCSSWWRSPSPPSSCSISSTTFPPPDLTIKATGHAWNWTHEYPDQGISVDSVMLQDDERAAVVKSGMPARAGAAQPRRRQRDARAGQQGGARARHLDAT